MLCGRLLTVSASSHAACGSYCSWIYPTASVLDRRFCGINSLGRTNQPHPNSMRDWKFLLTIIATLAGVAVPVLLWQWELSSKALTVSVKSLTSLSPQRTDLLPDLKLLASGKELQNPFLALIEIRNSGSRSIQSTDFEGPLELRTQSKSEFLTYRIIRAAPSDLRPTVSVSKDIAQIAPQLLNPRDSYTLEVIVSGDEGPNFAARARISGVSNLEMLHETDSNRKDGFRSMSSYICAFLLIMLYSRKLFTALDRCNSPRDRIKAVFIGLLSAVSAGLLARPYFVDLPLLSWELLTPIAAAVILGAMPSLFAE